MIYALGKIILVLYLWTLILLSSFIVINYSKILIYLKDSEESFKQLKREAVHDFSPNMAAISRKHKLFHSIFELKYNNFTEFVSSSKDNVKAYIDKLSPFQRLLFYGFLIKKTFKSLKGSKA